jgi:hypothetical protein
MAVNRVCQREIVEVPFILPDGAILPHPALVISRDELQEDEDGMFYAVLISTKQHFSDYVIKIENEWLNRPLAKQSFVVTHIVNMFNVEDIMGRRNCFIKQRYFHNVIDAIRKNIIG